MYFAETRMYQVAEKSVSGENATKQEYACDMLKN